MTPDQYNYEMLRKRRAEMTPWEVFQEMSPTMRELITEWKEEDKKLKVDESQAK